MADITSDQGSLDQQPSNTIDTQNPPSTEEREIDREADDLAERASRRVKGYDQEHDIFTK